MYHAHLDLLCLGLLLNEALVAGIQHHKARALPRQLLTEDKIIDVARAIYVLCSITSNRPDLRLGWVWELWKRVLPPTVWMECEESKTKLQSCERYNTVRKRLPANPRKHLWMPHGLISGRDRSYNGHCRYLLTALGTWPPAFPRYRTMYRY